MTHFPQSLTSLSIDEFTGREELPSSLIHFKACDFTLNATSVVSKLPPSLESFVVTIYVDGADLVIPVLPPSIRKLMLGYDFSEDPGSIQNLLEHLPKSLT